MTQVQSQDVAADAEAESVRSSCDHSGPHSQWVGGTSSPWSDNTTQLK